MSIRARLALGAAAAVAIAIVLASVVVYFLVRSELRAQVDRNLQNEAAQIASVPRIFAVLAYPPNIYALDIPTPLFTGYFQLVGRDGRVYIPPAFVAPTPRLAVTDEVRAVAAGTAPDASAIPPMATRNSHSRMRASSLSTPDRSPTTWIATAPGWRVVSIV